MPFSVQPFVEKLQTRLDKEAPTYITHVEGGKNPEGENIEPVEWAAVWADATMLGAEGLIPDNSKLQDGRDAMYEVLLQSHSSQMATPHAIMKQAYVTFALEILDGFLPIALAAPPGGEPPFESLDGLGYASEDNKPWLQACGNMLNTWFLSGTMVYVIGPTPMTWL